MSRDPKELLRAIGRRVAELRQASNMTQEKFAEDLGWSVKYLQRVEAGRQNLSVVSLAHIAATLRVDVAKLMIPPASLQTRPGRPALPKAPPARTPGIEPKVLPMAANSKESTMRTPSRRGGKVVRRPKAP